jgi:hypothetical protein
MNLRLRLNKDLPRANLTINIYFRESHNSLSKNILMLINPKILGFFRVVFRYYDTIDDYKSPIDYKTHQKVPKEVSMNPLLRTIVHPSADNVGCNTIQIDKKIDKFKVKNSKISSSKAQ